MTEQTHSQLRELQELDRRIAETEDRVRAFEPQLDEVDEPATQLEQEVTTTRARIREMKVEEKRIELSADEKRQRTRKLQERLTEVRNVREEAAVGAELEMVQRALDGDEQEALTFLDQIRRLEQRLEEQETALEQARAELEPRRQELLESQRRAEGELAELREQREALASTVAPQQLRVYDRIRGSGRRQAVAELTPDGACGNCYSMIPLQLQNQIRSSGAMLRCEACGVILTAREDAEG